MRGDPWRAACLLRTAAAGGHTVARVYLERLGVDVMVCGTGRAGVSCLSWPRGRVNRTASAGDEDAAVGARSRRPRTVESGRASSAPPCGRSQPSTGTLSPTEPVGGAPSVAAPVVEPPDAGGEHTPPVPGAPPVALPQQSALPSCCRDHTEPDEAPAIEDERVWWLLRLRRYERRRPGSEVRLGRALLQEARLDPSIPAISTSTSRRASYLHVRMLSAVRATIVSADTAGCWSCHCSVRVGASPAGR